MQTLTLTERDVTRFNSKHSINGECWQWEKPHSTGYGYFNLMTSEGRKIFRAHRVSYILHVGPIPTGMQVDHTCYNKACVNPSHLRLTSHKENQENRPSARKSSSSGVRGVYWDSGRCKWGTCITHNNKRISVGRFDSKADADAAVTARRLELFTHNDADRELA